MQSPKSVLIFLALFAVASAGAAKPKESACQEALRTRTEDSLQRCFDSKKAKDHHITDESRGYAISKWTYKRVQIESTIYEFSRYDYGVVGQPGGSAYAPLVEIQSICSGMDYHTEMPSTATAVVDSEVLRLKDPNAIVRGVCGAFTVPEIGSLESIRCPIDGKILAIANCPR